MSTDNSLLGCSAGFLNWIVGLFVVERVNEGSRQIVLPAARPHGARLISIKPPCTRAASATHLISTQDVDEDRDLSTNEERGRGNEPQVLEKTAVSDACVPFTCVYFLVLCYVCKWSVPAGWITSGSSGFNRPAGMVDRFSSVTITYVDIHTCMFTDQISTVTAYRHPDSQTHKRDVSGSALSQITT